MQWQRVADNISALGQGVTSRAVRDHYNVMAKKYKARMAQEERSTGEGGAELTEAESLLEELIHIEGEMDELTEAESLLEELLKVKMKKTNKGLNKSEVRLWR